MILRIGFIITLLATASSAWADLREIQLKDGSIITGEVRSFDGETYVIDSNTLGRLSVNSAKIQAIRSPGEIQAPPVFASSDLLNMQQQLLNDGEILDMIKALQDDPQIQAILNDPRLLQAISSGDAQFLMNNEQFQALVNHPKIQAISRKVQP